MSETAKQWYVVRTIGGKENKVKEYIESEIRHSHLEEYISQVLIPTEKVYTIRNGKKVSKEKVSYPGYVLKPPLSVRSLLSFVIFPTCSVFWVTPRRTAAR
mgnify:CR=1 FL=1